MPAFGGMYQLFLAGVHSSYMATFTVPMDKLFVAIFAAVSFLARMNAPVLLQIIGQRKTFATRIAQMIFGFRVAGHVFV